MFMTIYYTVEMLQNYDNRCQRGDHRKGGPDSRWRDARLRHKFARQHDLWARRVNVRDL